MVKAAKNHNRFKVESWHITQKWQLRPRRLVQWIIDAFLNISLAITSQDTFVSSSGRKLLTKLHLTYLPIQPDSHLPRVGMHPQASFQLLAPEAQPQTNIHQIYQSICHLMRIQGPHIWNQPINTINTYWIWKKKKFSWSKYTSISIYPQPLIDILWPTNKLVSH